MKPEDAVSEKEPRDGGSQITDRTTTMELDESRHEALKVISDLGSSVGFDKILNVNRLTANIEHIRASKNILFYEQLDKTREHLERFSDRIDKMENHMLDLKTVSKTSI